MLVKRFQGRCPLYGSMAVATPDVTVEIHHGPLSLAPGT